jgi:hypothetical protein
VFVPRGHCFVLCRSDTLSNTTTLLIDDTTGYLAWQHGSMAGSIFPCTNYPPSGVSVSPMREYTYCTVRTEDVLCSFSQWVLQSVTIDCLYIIAHPNNLWDQRPARPFFGEDSCFFCISSHSCLLLFSTHDATLFNFFPFVLCVLDECSF